MPITSNGKEDGEMGIEVIGIYRVIVGIYVEGGIWIYRDMITRDFTKLMRFLAEQEEVVAPFRFRI